MQLECGAPSAALLTSVIRQVRQALEEDGYDHDLSTLALSDQTAHASVIVYDQGILCGTIWFDEVFAEIDDTVVVDWFAVDGDTIVAKQKLCTLTGRAQSLLCGERCALNFLQSLSATATAAAAFVNQVKKAALTPKQVAVTDTRKTLPGLRLAQKYAVVCGGATNHRQGLSDAILLKENHLRAYGSLMVAVRAIRRQYPNLSIEVEAENLDEVRAALAAKVEIIMLDNFSLTEIHDAVALISGRAEIEASGNITLDNIAAIAQTGVDRISVGAITKHIHALDMSMRLD